MGTEDLKKKYGIGEVEGDVSIEVRADEKNVTLTSRTIGRGTDYIDVLPFTYNGKVLSFQGSGIHMKLSAVMGPMHIEFGVQEIKLARTDDGSLAHRVFSNEKNGLKNLREYKRFSLIEEGTFTLLGSQKEYDCEVRDISYGGFLVVVKGREYIPVKELLNLSFACHIGVVPISIKTNGLIARAQYNGDRDETIIGVKLLVNNSSVKEAVNRIQREELQKLKHA